MKTDLINKVHRDQLAEFFDSRRSYYPRQYTGERIPDEEVMEILEYAGTAPNHKNTRPWNFKVYSDGGKDWLISQMKEYYLENTPAEKVSQQKVKSFDMKMEKTSHILAIWVKFDSEERIPQIEEIMATAAAVENIYLALASYGIGGYWSTGKFTFSEEAKNVVGLDASASLLGFFYMGKVASDIPRAERPSVANQVEWIKTKA